MLFFYKSHQKPFDAWKPCISSGEIVQICLRNVNYILNILSMYIVYILNPLVIDIKNIFNTMISVVYPTTLGIEKISVEIASRQTSQ